MHFDRVRPHAAVCARHLPPGNRPPGAPDAAAQAAALCTAMAAVPGVFWLITGSNADAGGAVCTAAMQAFAAAHPAAVRALCRASGCGGIFRPCSMRRWSRAIPVPAWSKRPPSACPPSTSAAARPGASCAGTSCPCPGDAAAIEAALRTALTPEFAAKAKGAPKPLQWRRHQRKDRGDPARIRFFQTQNILRCAVNSCFPQGVFAAAAGSAGQTFSRRPQAAAPPHLNSQLSTLNSQITEGRVKNEPPHRRSRFHGQAARAAGARAGRRPHHRPGWTAPPPGGKKRSRSAWSRPLTIPSPPALAAARPDAALVCTAPLSHAAIITELLKAGLPVFTELNLVDDGYDRNLALAREKGVPLFLSSTMLYRRETQFIKAQVAAFGRPVHYIYHIGQYLPDWHPWENYKNFFVGNARTGGVREILGIDLPWLLDAFGPADPAGVTVRTDTISALGLPYPDCATLLLRHRGGAQGVLVADVVSPKAVRSFECYGEGLHLFWEGNPKALYEFKDGEKRPVDTYASFEHDSRYSDNIVEKRLCRRARELLCRAQRRGGPALEL